MTIGRGMGTSQVIARTPTIFTRALVLDQRDPRPRAAGRSVQEQDRERLAPNGAKSVRARATSGAEDGAAWTHRGRASARVQQEPAARQHELQLAAAVPVERGAAAWRDLDHTAVHIRAAHAAVDDEFDACTWEAVRSSAPRRRRTMHRYRRRSSASDPHLCLRHRCRSVRQRSGVMVRHQMQLTMREAIKLAIADEMRADPSVVVFGEDVADAGGVFKVTAGLLEEFGADRVRDTPISETAIIGAAVGAAAKGLRPVVEIMFAEFFGVALDQVVTEAAKMRYLSGGEVEIPIVLRASAGGGLGFGSQHSQTLESWFMNTPGLVVVSPSGAAAAYGLLRCAIRDQDPVIFLESRNLYNTKEEVETGDAGRWALGTARIVREGKDITIVALGQMVGVARAATDLLPDISCELIDLGTARPWDRATVLGSVERTGRFLIVEENPLTGGWGADVASAVAAEGFEFLDAPPVRVACPDVPVPFGALERHYLPNAERVARAVEALVRNGTPTALPTAPAAGATSSPSPADRGAQTRRRAALADPLERLARMIEIRLVEDESMNLYLEGLIAGSMHTGQGQEGVAVGMAASLRPTDTVTCTYRGHALALALGLTPLALLAEMLGRTDGPLGGKGGSMHLSAPGVGLLPTFAIVGAGLPVAVGAAYASQ